MNWKKNLTALTIAGIALSGSIVANAGTSWSKTEYLSVPGHNGSTTSSTQNKSKSNASSDLKVTSVSKKNSIDVRAIGGAGQGTGGWVRNVNTGSYAIPNPVKAGHATQLQYSSDLTSPNISMGTKWKSN